MKYSSVYSQHALNACTVETGWELHIFCNLLSYLFSKYVTNTNQRSIGPVNAHLITWPRKAQNIHNLVKK